MSWWGFGGEVGSYCSFACRDGRMLVDMERMLHGLWGIGLYFIDVHPTAVMSWSSVLKNGSVEPKPPLSDLQGQVHTLSFLLSCK